MYYVTGRSKDYICFNMNCTLTIVGPSTLGMFSKVQYVNFQLFFFIIFLQ